MAVLPGCFLLGGVFCMACDWILRTVFSPTELAISTATAFFRRAGRYRDGTQAGEADTGETDFELDNLSVGYGRRVLLKDLCASILPGQILTLIGPNGAGKSTTQDDFASPLACWAAWCASAAKISSGWTAASWQKRLSVVLTERVRPELMTCYDVAASGRYPYTGRFGMLTAQDRDVIAQSLALVRVEELADKPFARVSDGQRQRVMIARASASSRACWCSTKPDLLSGYSI